MESAIAPEPWGRYHDDEVTTQLSAEDAAAEPLASHARHFFYCRRQPRRVQNQHIRFPD